MREISRIIAGDTSFNPVLLVTAVKGLQPAAVNEKSQRYRLTLTDGQDTIPGMLATQLNEMIERNIISVGTKIQLTEYVLNELQNQKIVILLGVKAVGNDPNMMGGIPPPQSHAKSASPYHQPSHSLNQPSASPFHHPPVPPPKANPAPYSNNPYDSNRGIAESKHQSPYSRPSAPYDSKPQSSYSNLMQNNKPISRIDESQAITPINALNPYSNRWTIKARITSKSEMRRWSNARGEGTLFSIDLLDSVGGEIRATFFKDACEKWFPILEEQQVYTFSGGRLKVGDRKFSTIKNDYELTFDANSEIRPVANDSDIKTMSYNFVKIADIASKDVNASVDILAIVRSATDCSEVVSSKLGGKVLFKRDLVVYDDSGYDIRLTLWGEKAQAETPWSEGPIIAVKGCTVGDYNGKTLSLRQGSTLSINPPVDEAFQLYQWRMSGGDSAPSASMSTGGGGGGPTPLDQRVTLASIKDDGLGMKEKPDYISIKGTVTYIRHENEPWYTACPNLTCNRKVVEGFNQQWTCEKCNQEFPNCVRRYILSMTMSDHSGQSWFSMFNDTAVELLGYTAEQLYEMKMSGDSLGYESVFTNAQFKTFTARARVKQENVNDELRLKCSIVKLDPIDYNSECKQMIDAIKKYA